MKRKFCWLTPCVITGLVFVAGGGNAETFQLQCSKLPFPVATQARPIDGACGITGDQTDGPKALQNSLKNNLCRNGEVTTLHQTDFVALQQTVSAQGIKFGASGFGTSRREFFPMDRAALAQLITVNGHSVGEGTYVQFVAYMDNPHYSDTSSGESVNCKMPGNSPNDIHINMVQKPAPAAPKKNDPNHDALVAARNKALCQGAVVAEIVPHYRPTQWEQNQLRAVANQHIPVRTSGQLFFDASHYPCNGSQAHNGEKLLRVSLWEIHPVYSVDVCRKKTLQACRADDDAAWVPLDEWLKSASAKHHQG
jgi:hypothetical protein